MTPAASLGDICHRDRAGAPHPAPESRRQTSIQLCLDPRLRRGDNYAVNEEITVLLGRWSGGFLPRSRSRKAAEGGRRAGAFFFAPASLSSALVMNCREKLPKPVCFGLDQLFFSL